MITIAIVRDAQARIQSFRATGHAGCGPAGADIVCAAVTGIAATIIGSLQDLCGLAPGYQLEDGLIAIELPPLESLSRREQENASLLMDALELGCRQIQNSYPGTIRFRQSHNKGG